MTPELLAPAGNLEKCKIALLYGASAVYLSGQKFGLRAAAANLSESELQEAVAFAHVRQKKVYVTVNGFLHQDELEALPEFLRFLEQIQVDALIVSDLGVLRWVRKSCSLPIHISTQASVVNHFSAKLWKSLGATRIIVGRELSIQEAATLGRKAQIEIEMFIHGALCMSYSGHCIISNYTAGRDSNRGGCKQSCRFEYTLQHPEKTQHAFFMSSKDLNGMALLSEFFQEGITSLKIEGRMKSNLYVATLVKAYRSAIDHFAQFKTLSPDVLTPLLQMTEATSHRDYTEASLRQKASSEATLTHNEESSNYQMVGTILEVNPSFVLATVKQGIGQEKSIEVLPFQGPPISVPITQLMDIRAKPLTQVKPNTMIRFPVVPGMEPLNLLRVATPIRHPLLLSSKKE